jgi:3-hydroxypropanoate dehydrogenase
MLDPLPDACLDRLFRTARTQNVWAPDPISDDELRAIWDLAKFGPTSANSLPMRIVWVKSPAAKARLLPALSAGNRDKTMAAPVTAIVAFDLDFPDTLSETFPHRDMRKAFTNEKERYDAAFRNGSLQGAYLIMAARALGYDCGPMSGFDNATVDAEFFPEGRIKSNFLCSIGRGTGEKVLQRLPRLPFDRIATIL